MTAIEANLEDARVRIEYVHKRLQMPNNDFERKEAIQDAIEKLGDWLHHDYCMRELEKVK